MKILILHGSIVEHDAIGNDIYWMSQTLKPKYEVFLYTPHLHHSRIHSCSIEEAKNIIGSPENLVIYHHSIFWELGESLLAQCKAKLVFKFHNVTPAHFFAPYCPRSAATCEMGQAQTLRFAEMFPHAMWLNDSNYNSEVASPKSLSKVVPPFHQIDSWKTVTEDSQIESSLASNPSLKVLMVGRLAPNKGHLKAIEIIDLYRRRYDTKIELFIIGKCYTPLFLFEIRMLIAKLNLESHVHFIGEINERQLMAYYKNCDVQLVVSEHEGFCVPVIEAQYFGLPVVALDIPAVRETLGPNQVCLPNDNRLFVSALRLLRENQEMRMAVGKIGRSNFINRFHFNQIGSVFTKALQGFGIQI